MIGIKFAIMEQSLINVIPVYHTICVCELLPYNEHLQVLQSVVLINFILNGEANYYDCITVRVLLLTMWLFLENYLVFWK